MEIKFEFRKGLLVDLTRKTTQMENIVDLFMLDMYSSVSPVFANMLSLCQSVLLPPPATNNLRMQL